MCARPRRGDNPARAACGRPRPRPRATSRFRTATRCWRRSPTASRTIDRLLARRRLRGDARVPPRARRRAFPPAPRRLAIDGRGLRGLLPPPAARRRQFRARPCGCWPASCGASFRTVIDGDASLARRPMRRVIEPLDADGRARIDAEDGRPPLDDRRRRDCTELHIEPEVPSAQVKSAVLLAGLQAAGDARASSSRLRPATTRSAPWTHSASRVDRDDGARRGRGRPAAPGADARRCRAIFRAPPSGSRWRRHSGLARSHRRRRPESDPHRGARRPPARRRHRVECVEGRARRRAGRHASASRTAHCAASRRAQRSAVSSSTRSLRSRRWPRCCPRAHA